MKIVLGLLILICGIVGTEQHANAQQPPPGAVVRINPLEISGLGNQVGKYLTVIYARGSRASISTSPNQISVLAINKEQKVKIDGDKVRVKEMDLQKSGLWMFYNLIIFVVHRDEQFTWKNYSPDEYSSTMSNGVIVDSLTKEEFEELRRIQLENKPTTGLETIRYQMKLTP